MATKRPAENGTTPSPRACITSVGTVTWGRNCETSTCPRAMSSSAATAGEVVFWQRSLNQFTCSGFASGMKRAVKICRKTGLSRPQPMRASSAMDRHSFSAASSPRREKPLA